MYSRKSRSLGHLPIAVPCKNERNKFTGMKLFTIVFHEMTSVAQRHHTMKKVRARTVVLFTDLLYASPTRDLGTGLLEQARDTHKARLSHRMKYSSLKSHSLTKHDLGSSRQKNVKAC